MIYKIIKIYLPFLVITRLLISFILPETYHDPVTMYLPTFRFMVGDYYYQLSHLYGSPGHWISPHTIISAIFFTILPISQFSFSLYIAIIAIMGGLITVKLCKSNIENNKLNIFLLILTYFSSIYSYTGRIENFAIILILLIQVPTILFPKYCNKLINIIIIEPILLSSTILVHPVAGVIASLQMLFLFFSNRRSLLLAPLIMLSIIIFLFIISFGSIIDYYNYYVYLGSIENRSPFDILLICKYFLFNPMYLIFLYLLIKQSSNNLKLFAIIFFVTFVISIFGRSYYYPYYITFIPLVFYYDKVSISSIKLFDKGLIIIALLIGTFWTIGFHSIQLIENPSYITTYHQVRKFIKEELEFNDPSHNYWVPDKIYMEVAKYQNLRYHQYATLNIPGGITLQSGDKIYYENPSDLSYLNRAINNENTKIKNLVSPVKGLIRSRYFPRLTRSDSLGLWVIELDVD